MHRCFMSVGEDRNSAVSRQNYSGFIIIKFYNRRFIFKINEATDIATIKDLVINTIQGKTKCSNLEVEYIFEGVLKYLEKNRL